MSRRFFFQAIGGATVVAAVAPALIESSEAPLVLPAGYVDAFQLRLAAEFGKKGTKIGDTIFVRKPMRFVGRDGAAWRPESMKELTEKMVFQ